MTTNTTEFLAEQKRLTEAATPGPWEVDQSEPGIWCSKHIVIGNYTASDMFESPAWEDGKPEDLAFIAAARTSVPKLIAALEAVEALHQPCTYWHHPDIEGEEGEQWFGEEQHLINAARRHFDAIEEPFDWEVERLACTTKVYCEACMKVVYEACEPYPAPMSPEAIWPCLTIRAVEAARGGDGDAATS